MTWAEWNEERERRREREETKVAIMKILFFHIVLVFSFRRPR